jgi:DNA-binding GntR family transcriptional regulator
MTAPGESDGDLGVDRAGLDALDGSLQEVARAGLHGRATPLPSGGRANGAGFRYGTNTLAAGRLGQGLLSVRTRVYRSLKAAILAGRWPAGERLTEERVTGELQASRTPVREALHRLEVEGVVVRAGRRGHAVPPPSAEVRDDLLELGAVLEGYALRILCDRIAPEALAALHKTVQRADAALAHGNPREAAQWHGRFHASVRLGISDRRRLADGLNDSAQHLIRYRSPGIPSVATCRRIADQHREILVALQLGDPDVCERLMRAHGCGVDALVCLPSLTMRGH